MAWHNNVKVNALWSNHERSNAWGWIDGAWRKFDDQHDDACTNTTVLAAHAKAGNHNVNARIEDNRVRELYVW
jgi:hypothetical protein